MFALKIAFIFVLCASMFLCACGLKGPPVPPDKPTANDEVPDAKSKRIQIVDDTGKRLFELYGESPLIERGPETLGVPDELEEVPPELRYLYKKEKDDRKDDQKKDQKDEGDRSDEK
jgi:predicted small lipoprotein YifL